MAAKRKKRLRKTLPKDIEASMDAAAESGDYTAVHAALEACEVDARGGYGKGTPLMMGECTPELAKWIVARGTDINAFDTYGNSALHASARSRFRHRLSPADLIELGADVNAASKDGLTPLHSAVDGKHLEAVRVLIAHGADVHAAARGELTPLEYGLQRMSNIDLPAMLPVVETMLEAGAEVTPRAQEFMRAAGERFEFHRASINAEFVDDASAALVALGELLGVAAAPARKTHDGVSSIVAQAETWQKQHKELWDLLVPSRGACETLQGEVIRIAGRIGDELQRNGGMNWDAQYRAMASAFCEHIASHNAIQPALVTECRAVVRRFPRDIEATAKLAQLSVTWVALNPEPIPLPAPTYSR